MTTTFIQPGHVLDHTPAGAVANGAVVIMGSTVGVAITSIAAGTRGAVRISGVFELAKLGTDTIDQGQAVYWDAVNGRVTEVAAGNTLMGVAALASGNGVVTCRVLLNGNVG